MPRYAGKSLVVMVENGSSAEVALTFVTAVTINDAYDENTTMGDTVKAALAGQRVSEIVVDYEYDTTATTGNQAVLDGIDGDNVNPRFIRVRPIGTASGSPQFSMDAVLLRFGPVGVSRENTIVAQAIFKNHHAASADPVWANQ